jgi:hypothetical protein
VYYISGDNKRFPADLSPIPAFVIDSFMLISRLLNRINDREYMGNALCREGEEGVNRKYVPCFELFISRRVNLLSGD